ncbi:hypothetical protein B6U82_00300 [Candidatus Pacearchaeota archaeon ex4484_31]|nr:MAG: hypothetical protein B6U82_00300 [Candidatus Pacearchaeota archaeon ex4484_31]
MATNEKMYEEYEKEFSIEGTLKEISSILYTTDGRVRTDLYIESDENEIESFLEKIASLQEPLKFDPTFCSSFSQGRVRKNLIEVAFFGNVHSDIIGKKVLYKIRIENPYRNSKNPKNVLIQQTLIASVGDKKRLYFSEFWKK